MHAVVDDVFYDRAGAPVALVFGDDATRRERLVRLIAACGGRVAGEGGIVEAAARLDAQAVAHIVAIDAAGADEARLDALLDRIAVACRAARFDALVVLPEPMIDRAGLLVGLAGVTLATGLDEAGAALDTVMPRYASGVAEEGDEQRRKLAALGEEAGRIARALAAMAADPDGEDPVVASPDPAAELGFLRTHIRLRRLRERCFDAGLFADPAWDILLDLRLAALEGRRVAVSSLCIAAAVPPTTGLRWIGLMTQQGLLARVADPADGRRAFIALSPAADAAMARFAGLALRIGSA